MIRLVARRGLMGVKAAMTRPLQRTFLQQPIQQARANLNPTGRSSLCSGLRFLSTENKKMEFKAETKKLLDIVAKSIYTETEVFLRELLSNCSDALEKQRIKELSGSTGPGEEPLFVEISTNDRERTLTIFDSGIGMSKQQMIDNLGTIAYSGSSKFLEEYSRNNTKTIDSLIGQFGVGFYSTFIVSDFVEVISKSEDHPAAKWTSDGEGTFEVEDIEDPGFKRGTKIILKLKSNCRQFAKEREVENIIKKYSLFISHPIKLNGDLVNSLQALWYRDKKDVSEDEHQRFFEYIVGKKAHYKYVLHYSSDVPLTIKALLYIPVTHSEKMGMNQETTDISLYSRKVLIKHQMADLLPKYLRFVKGVIDCEDLPLNLSRETYQGSSHIEKIKVTIAKRIIKLLEDEMKRDPESYTLWYKEFSPFIKEGLAIDQENSEALLRLVRFNNSIQESSISLEEYISKLRKDTNKIYYFYSTSRENALSSPYYTPFKQVDIPVLFTEHHLDEMCLKNVGKYKGNEFVNIESSFEEICREFEKKYPEKFQNTKSSSIPEGEVNSFTLWIKNELNQHISKVTLSNRLGDTPAAILGQMSTSMRQLMSMFDPSHAESMLKDLHLDINNTHPLIAKLNGVRKTDITLASLMAKCLLDYAMLNSGIPFNMNDHSARLIKVMEKVADSRLEGEKENDTIPKIKRQEHKPSEPIMKEAKSFKPQKHSTPRQQFIINENGEPEPLKNK